MGIRLGGRREPRIQSVIGVLAPLALLLCVIGACLVFRDFTSCNSASQDALTEFPHYEDAFIDIGPTSMAANEETCGGRITTTGDAKQVLAHYGEQLVALGWSVSEGRSERNESMEYRSILGERGDLCYVVGVERHLDATSDEKRARYNDANSGEKWLNVGVDKAGSCR
jgi:hypothetical protein